MILSWLTTFLIFRILLGVSIEQFVLLSLALDT